MNSIKTCTGFTMMQNEINEFVKAESEETKMNYNKAMDYFCTLPEAERKFISGCANEEIFNFVKTGKTLSDRQRRNRFVTAINNYAKTHGHENE